MRNEAESASGGESKEDPREKKRKIILIWEGIALALMIIGLIILGYFTYRFYVPDTSTSSPLPTPRPSASKSSSPSASACASTLTSTDKTDTNLWKTYTNSKYNYSFKYPQNWVTGSESSNDEVVLKDNTIISTFYFKTATVSIAEGYRLIKEESAKVVCIDAVKKSYSGNEPGGEDARIITTKFEKGGQEFNIELGYTDRGASITGDVIDAYDLILKTVEFK
jgi:flagellar basal body-associated protein FliL